MDRRFVEFCNGGSMKGRMLVVAAHPDDETIGAGIRMAMQPELLLVHSTDGAPRDPRFVSSSFQGGGAEDPVAAYAAARRGELEEAMGMIGLMPGRMLSLDLPDLETMCRLPELARGLYRILRDFHPDIIVTHAYEGGHPDHDATALALHAAVALAREDGTSSPLIIEMTGYHRRFGLRATADFLPPNNTIGVTPEKFAYYLNADEIRLKSRMLDCFRTQSELLARLNSPIERFRIAPCYDFTAPPHSGSLHYEALGWPITGASWREHAASAVAQLGVGGFL